VTITSAERDQLDQGSPISRVLEAKGLEVAWLAAVPVNVDGDRLMAWVRRIELFKKNPAVLAIGRFSDPPRIEDLAGLELDADDVAAIRSCRPRACALKLSAKEMAQLQQARAGGDSNEAVQATFRQLILDRVEQYLATGQIPPDEDHRDAVQPSSEFASLLKHTPFLTEHLPQLTKSLQDPSNAGSQGESSLYWSKERLGRKATVSVTHLYIERNQAANLPDVVIIGRDIFSDHYVDASLSVTALMRGDRTNYLVYVNRTEVDVLHGVFGCIIRRSIQHRLKDSANVLQDLRKRLESGDPPAVVSSGRTP
jgi:hypothetical protein